MQMLYTSCTTTRQAQYVKTYPQYYRLDLSGYSAVCERDVHVVRCVLAVELTRVPARCPVAGAVRWWSGTRHADAGGRVAGCEWWGEGVGGGEGGGVGGRRWG